MPDSPSGAAKKSGPETFSSSFGSVMTLIGVAVGLANVWRFPYMAGSYGGAVFVGMYLFFGLILGIPAVMAEWTLGRLTRSGPAGAFVAAGMPGGKWVGFALFVTVFMAASYYTLIVGQVLIYAVQSFAEGPALTDPDAFLASALSGITLWNVGFTGGTLAAIAIVLFLGVRRGIESASRYIVPLVFVTLLIVIARSLTLPGAMDGVRFFLLPDFNQLTPSTMLAALGQVFFSLSLGGTFFLVYGSYLPAKANIPRMAFATAFGDLGAAMLGGLAILPAVFAMGIEPTSGPTLLFQTLPRVFANMPGGSFVGGLFFLALFLAAFLSALAAIEVLVNALQIYFGWGRRRAVVLLVAAELVVAMPSMLSSDFLMWNDLIWGSTMQPLGSALTLVALGWFIHRGRALKELVEGSQLRLDSFWAKAWFAWIRWVVPTAILIVLVYGWWPSG